MYLSECIYQSRCLCVVITICCVDVCHNLSGKYACGTPTSSFTCACAYANVLRCTFFFNCLPLLSSCLSMPRMCESCVCVDIFAFECSKTPLIRVEEIKGVCSSKLEGLATKHE